MEKNLGILVESNPGRIHLYKGSFSDIGKKRGIKMNFKILVADDEYYARKALC